MKDFLKRRKFRLLGLTLFQLVWYEVGQLLSFRALSISGNIFIIVAVEIVTISLILWHFFYKRLPKNHKSAIVYMSISLLVSFGFETYFGETAPFPMEIRTFGNLCIDPTVDPGNVKLDDIHVMGLPKIIFNPAPLTVWFLFRSIFSFFGAGIKPAFLRPAFIQHTCESPGDIDDDHSIIDRGIASPSMTSTFGRCTPID